MAVLAGALAHETRVWDGEEGEGETVCRRSACVTWIEDPNAKTTCAKPLLGVILATQCPPVNSFGSLKLLIQ